MPSFPGPYQLEVTYIGASLSHKMRIDVRVDGTPTPGTPLATIDLLTRIGGATDLLTALDVFLDLITPFFAIDTVFNDVTLWRIEPLSFERTFINSAPLSKIGTGAGSIIVAHQRIWTFRTEGGGILKVYMMEDNSNSNNKTPYADFLTERKAFADFVTSAASFLYARDNTYPIASLYESQGQNEALWRKRYR